MKQIGNIQLPLQGTVKVTGADWKILDYIWDMKIPNMTQYLSKVHEADLPTIMVVNVPMMKFVGVFLFRPPDIWLDFDHQKYQLFISPTLGLLHHYWTDRRMRTHDVFEAGLITKIIEFVELNIKQQSSVSTTL